MAQTPITGFRLSPRLLQAIDAVRPDTRTAFVIAALEAKLAADTPPATLAPCQPAPYVAQDEVLEDPFDLAAFERGFVAGWEAHARKAMI